MGREYRGVAIMVAHCEPGGTGTRVGAELRAMLGTGALDLPLPGGGRTRARWDALAGWGRRDLALARLAEGHTDATAILAEIGRTPEPDALYGVWAARSAGTGARLVSSGGRLALDGTVRFCSGARIVDRALVVAATADASDTGMLLVDVPVTGFGARADPGTWNTSAMAAADTLDVRFDDVAVPPGSVVGDPGWYTARPGFAAGGAGVAAVWWGGGAGVLDRVMGHVRREPDAHQLAHLGELHALLQAADALLGRVAAAVDAAPGADHAQEVAEVRSAVERAVREVVDRAPRMVGPGPLSRDGHLAAALADLALYLRQHHGERDHAALGAQVLAARQSR